MFEQKLNIEKTALLIVNADITSVFLQYIKDGQRKRNDQRGQHCQYYHSQLSQYNQLN